jgi:S-(hydroxymethyl)glutathione dehydrogenase/alcohol dehydrogenase
MTQPTRTLAAILVEQQKPLVVAEINLPESLEVGQVLVEFFYSGICGSQLGEIDGVKGPDKWLPHLLGHEASGKVLAIGPGVKHVKPGDHVVAHWRPSLGIEASTPKYRWNGQTVNAGWVTTFNQFGVISENRLTSIPAETDLKAAALYGCAITTGFGTIDNVAKIRLGESVVVFGAGGIGLNIVQAASLAGASTIIAIDRFDGRLALALRCGATACINSEAQDPWNAINQVLGSIHGKKKALDVFIDNTGNASIIARGYETVGTEGRVVLVGVPKAGDEASIHTLGLHFGRSITGTTGGEANPHEDIGRYMGLAKARKIDFGSLITEFGPLVDVNRLIDDMRQGKGAGRSLISFGS